MYHTVAPIAFLFGKPLMGHINIGFNPICHGENHYNDVIMGAVASQITSLTIVYSTVYSGSDQRKHQSSASLAFVRGIHQWPVNSPHKWPVTRKMFPFDDVIMLCWCLFTSSVLFFMSIPSSVVQFVLEIKCRLCINDEKTSFIFYQAMSAMYIMSIWQTFLNTMCHERFESLLDEKCD